MSSRIQVVMGDVTTYEADALVNSANPGLRWGSGVSGAFAVALGSFDGFMESELLREYPFGIHTTEVAVSPWPMDNAKYLLHAVGPVWHGEGNEGELLRLTYRHIIKMAKQLGCESIACPSISTGVYLYPLIHAVYEAVNEVTLALQDTDLAFTWVCNDLVTYQAYKEAL